MNILIEIADVKIRADKIVSYDYNEAGKQLSLSIEGHTRDWSTYTGAPIQEHYLGTRSSPRSSPSEVETAHHDSRISFANVTKARFERFEREYQSLMDPIMDAALEGVREGIQRRKANLTQKPAELHCQ